MKTREPLYILGLLPYINLIKILLFPQTKPKSLTLFNHHNTLRLHKPKMIMTRSLSVRSITMMILMALLVWSVTLETCIARRGRHWRHNHRTSSDLSDSLSSKKQKSHGNSHHSSHNNHNNNHHHKSKPKPKPKLKTPPKAKDNNSPVVSRPPKVQPPPLPPQKGSQVFSVMDFGAKGDGKCDDTKVQ